MGQTDPALVPLGTVSIRTRKKMGKLEPKPGLWREHSLTPSLGMGSQHGNLGGGDHWAKTEKGDGARCGKNKGEELC